MTPEERQLLTNLQNDVRNIKKYTTNLGGSLEFRTLIKRYVLGIGGELEVEGTFTHTGTKIGFFGTTPVGQQASISDPSGGLTVDAEARSAIDDILDVLDAYGLTS